jgi:hypothetical protein
MGYAETICRQVFLNSDKKMEQRDQDRQQIDATTEGTGRLRSGVATARAGVGSGADRVRLCVEDAAWFLREHIAWPVEDGLGALGTRGRIGVFGGGGIALAAVVAAAIALSGGAGGSGGSTTEAFVATPAPAATRAVAPAPKPEKKTSKPTGPTLHGAPPDFAPSQDVKAGVGDGKALDGSAKHGGPSGGVPAERGAAAGAAPGSVGDEAVTSDRPTATASSAGDSAATAKIGATPEATASGAAQTDGLATSGAARVEENSEFAGEPAPRAAKRVARHFAEAFVVYEVGGVDSGVRDAFHQTSTKQLSKSLLRRPPRQPASVKVPKAKVVTVVAGPSKGSVYTVSVSLLRVGVTSELRLQMERGAGKKWQVTNVLG